jgi:hypothetical protein
MGVNGIAEPSQGNLMKRRVTNRCQPVDEAAVASFLEHGSMALAFLVDPGLREAHHH